MQFICLVCAVVFSSTGWGQSEFGEIKGRVLYLVDHQHLIVRTEHKDWQVGEVIAVESQAADVGIIGFLEVLRLERGPQRDYEIKARLIRGSAVHFIQSGDTILKLDLSGDNEAYKGTTQLIIEKSETKTAARYKPLVFQGFLIGETAQTLWQGESLLTWYGDYSYGITERMSVRSLLPANFYDAYNLKTKYRAYSSVSSTVSVGLSLNEIPDSTESAINFDFYWDSISSESTISHTFVTLALFSFNRAEKVTAIKSLGSSAIQSGYEIIMDDWSRVLVGPVYNFEKKALGGYLSYMKIWDHFHFSATISTTNVASLKIAPEDGYYGLLDAFWRF